jgi:uncharacterized protein (TIGR02246 family)
MSVLEEIINRFRDAWNRHDAGALAALWVENGELHHPWGERRVGRDAIRELLHVEHSTNMAGSELLVERITTSDRADSVSAEIDGVLKGVRAPNGRTYDLPHVLSALFVREGEEWQIRTMTAFANPRRRDA